jgi:hypothetical protein
MKRRIMMIGVFLLAGFMLASWKLSSRGLGAGPSVTATPDVKVILSGHLLLRTHPPGSNKPFEVAAPSGGGAHVFSMYILKFKGTAMSMPYLQQPMTNYDLYIDVQRPVSPGAMRYGYLAGSGGTSGFPRSSSGNDENDFGWAVDLAELHPGLGLSWNAATAGNLVLIPAGLFYTSLRTDPQVACTTRKRASDGRRDDFFSLATQIAANINLQPGGSFSVRKNNSGGAIETSGGPFLVDGPNTRYEIHIENNPKSGGGGASDFPMYYDAISGVTAAQGYDFVFTAD